LLFEYRPQKDDTILMVPAVERFCLIINNRKSNCLSVTHYKKKNGDFDFSTKIPKGGKSFFRFSTHFFFKCIHPIDFPRPK